MQLAALLLTLPVATTQAQSASDAHPYLDGKFAVDLGVYFPESTFKISVAGSADIEPFAPIDFESQLQSNISEEIAAIEFAWRFGEKWSLRAQ